MESGGAPKYVVGLPQLHRPPSYRIIPVPECRRIAFVSTPDGVNFLQNAFLVSHVDDQKDAPADIEGSGRG